MSGKTKRTLISILLVIIVWAFLFPLIGWLTSTITDVMDYYNLTKVDIPLARFNTTEGEWYYETYQVDLKGILQIFISIIILLAPVIILLKVIL